MARNYFIPQRLLYQFLIEIIRYPDLRVDFYCTHDVIHITIRENPQGWWEWIKYMIGGQKVTYAVTIGTLENQPGAMHHFINSVGRRFDILFTRQLKDLSQQANDYLYSRLP